MCILRVKLVQTNLPSIVDKIRNPQWKIEMATVYDNDSCIKLPQFRFIWSSLAVKTTANRSFSLKYIDHMYFV